MKMASNLFIGLTAILHILFFKLESFDFMKPEVLARFGLDANSGSFVKIWAFNQGFYNLFFALGLLYSLYLINTEKVEKGVTLASFILISIIGAGVVLYFSAPEKYIAAAIQALPALLGVICLHLSLKGTKA